MENHELISRQSQTGTGATIFVRELDFVDVGRRLRRQRFFPSRSL